MRDSLREAALALLAALEPAQVETIRAPFDTDDRLEWTYLPGARPGLTLGEMSVGQRALAMRLVELASSARGLADACGVMAAEAIRRNLPQAVPGSTIDPYDDQRYFLRILGDPSDGPWAWRINGHHLAVHQTITDDGVSITPHFFGSEPATILDGPHTGRRFLAPEEWLARDLLSALEPGQRELAIVSSVAPRDILTRYDPVADPGLLHKGLAYGNLEADQRELFTRLVDQYVGRAAEPIAQRAWHDITEAGVERLTFAWAGSPKPGEGHYYSIAGPTFLLEYDNTQDDANHIHSVWRDLRNDWGHDLLARHYAQGVPNSHSS
ncbi:DUF3500 domain-containing protein [Kribbella sp. NBC_01245]|uniref:DUF3500 domain-containing protein n=1 Tax=Kribbella sp. NBC_01245 TaxID=2903578 RepID=UPI002E2E448C|nr:DUF3500 domain-containing protein [Kribbella sp. NBC_01245]